MRRYVVHKPLWFAHGGRVVSPAATLVFADWWDAWRIVWLSIGWYIEGGRAL